MDLLARLIALLLVVTATYFFVYWLPFSLVAPGRPESVASLVSLGCAAWAGWFVWRRMAGSPGGAGSSILLGAVLLGAIGFVAGFFGPILFAPEANQGPLLGIFITGPLGFLVGGILGYIWWAARVRKSHRADRFRARGT